MNTTTVIKTPKAKGKIQYLFRGMSMHSDNGTVVMQENNTLTVKRDSDDQLLNFVKIGRNWLLEKHTTNKSLLFGTQFIIDEQKNI